MITKKWKKYQRNRIQKKRIEQEELGSHGVELSGLEADANGETAKDAVAISSSGNSGIKVDQRVVGGEGLEGENFDGNAGDGKGSDVKATGSEDGRNDGVNQTLRDDNVNEDVDHQVNDVEISEEKIEEVTMENVKGAGSVDDDKGSIDHQVDDPEGLEDQADDAEMEAVKGAEEVEKKTPSKEEIAEKDDRKKKKICETGGGNGKEKMDEGCNQESIQGNEGSEKMEEEAEKDEDVESEEINENGDDKGKKKNHPRHGRAGANVSKERRRSKEMLEVPLSFYPDRPVRERKSVVRLVEVIEKTQDEGLLIDKGRGTPLKDIPNVARKISKIKHEDMKLLHLILFGRKGKAADFKTHILQFSGFVWHDNEEKQKSKILEKLNKCTKEQLLDLCNVFDLPAASTYARKDEIEKLLDFMVAPRAMTDIRFPETKQDTANSLKRKRLSIEIPSESSRKNSTKKRKGSEEASKLMGKDAEPEEEGHESGVEGKKADGISNGNDEADHSESNKENELNDSLDAASLETDKNLKKGKKLISRSPKKLSSSKKGPSKDIVSQPTSIFPKLNEIRNTSGKVFSRRKRAGNISKKKLTSNTNHAKTKMKSGKTKDSTPSDEDVKRLICQMLKEVDFNTTTFSDFLTLLGRHYNKDLTPRKENIKSMIKEELTKIAEAEVEEEDLEDEEEDGVDENALVVGKGFQTT